MRLVYIEEVSRLSTKAFERAASVILSLLIFMILLALFWAIIKTFMELTLVFDDSIHNSLKVVMTNALTILALLEVFKTSLAYFSEGRVKVTYIIDTVLVVILTEVMIFWYRDIEYSKIFMVIALVLSLIVARILTIRFSPARIGEEE